MRDEGSHGRLHVEHAVYQYWVATGIHLWGSPLSGQSLDVEAPAGLAGTTNKVVLRPAEVFALRPWIF